MWIDSHCHLNHKNIFVKGSPLEIIRAANLVGVDGILTICCQLSEEVDILLDITSNNKNVWCSIGTHPHDASKEQEKLWSVSDIVSLANSNDKIIGIGESGLDYYYNYSNKKDQQISFVKHIRASIESGLPIIIHTRNAEDDTYNIIKSEGVTNGVMHCFSSNKILAEQTLELGFYISFSGIVTFPNANELREVAKIVPIDRILIETDAPYLAPVPNRGKINEPAYLINTGEYLAGFYNMGIEEFAKITTENFFRLFKKAKLV